MAGEIESAWGAIDVLVNNAGVSQPLLLPLLEAADWDKVMDINAKGQFLAVRAMIRGMLRRKRGCILNIGSLAGVRIIESPVHYAASKAAIKGFTQALAKEMARSNIRVNSLAPGLLEEGVGQSLPEHRLKDYLRHVSLHRLGTLAEAARCRSAAARKGARADLHEQKDREARSPMGSRPSIERTKVRRRSARAKRATYP